MEAFNEVPILHHIIACIVVGALLLLLFEFLKSAAKALLTLVAILILCFVLARIYPFIGNLIVDFIRITLASEND